MNPVFQSINDYNDTVEAHAVISAFRKKGEPKRSREQLDAERSRLNAVLAVADRIGVVDARSAYKIDAADGAIYRNDYADGSRKRVATLAGNRHNGYRFADYFGRTERYAPYLLNGGDRLIVVNIPR